MPRLRPRFLTCAHTAKAVLKKPLHTSIAVEVDEFNDIEVEDKVHIIISVKDFRAILQHANSTSGELSAAYSSPGRPMKLSYHGDGILCEFTLMTVGEKSDAAQRSKRIRTNGPKSARPGLEAAPRGASVVQDNPPPATIIPREQAPRDHPARQSIRRQTQFEIRPTQMPPPPTFRSESLFVPQEDDDRQWEPVNPEDDEDDGDNARLEWDASNQPVWDYLNPPNPDECSS